MSGISSRSEQLNDLDEARSLADHSRLSPAAHARDVLTRRALVASDFTMTALTAWAILALIGDDVLQPSMLVALLLMPLVAQILGLYDNDDMKLRHSTLDEAPRLLAVAASVIGFTWLLEDTVIDGNIGHGQRIALLGLMTVALIVGRGLTRRAVTAALPPERCLIVGSSKEAEELATRFERSHTFKARVLARIDRAEDLTDNAFEGRERLKDLVRSHGAERIIVVPRSGEDLEIARAANSVGIKVSVVPRLFDTIGTSYTLDDLIGLTMLGMRRPRLTPTSLFIKRTFDIVLGSILAIVLAPFMILVAIAIKIDSPGRAIYRQRRVGRNEHEFTILKFRTMSEGSHRNRSHLRTLNEAEGLFKISDDPRVTRVGRVLRKTSLDELPQIFNVLRGDMSLVGPRPLIPEEDLLLSGWSRFRYRVSPGMTGPWQLGSAARFSIEDMASLDYVYVTNWSLWLDVKILLRTAVYVFGLHGR